LTILFVIKSKTLSGSLIPYTSDHGQNSSAWVRAGLSRALKFLLFRVFWVGVTLLTLMAATTGKWSVVESVRTLTVASRSFVKQTWSRTDSWPLASPSSLLWRPCERYMTPVVRYLMLASATALSCASIRLLRPYLMLHCLAVSGLMSPAKTMLSTSEAVACSWSLILVRAVYSRGRLDHSLYKPPTRK
jgi:hypothetical protein